MTARPSSRPPFEEEQDRPIAVSERRPIIMPLAILLAIVAATATTVFAYSRLTGSVESQKEAIQANGAKLADHELRIRTVEAAAQRMDANLQQIRDWMAEDRQRRALSGSRASNP